MVKRTSLAYVTNIAGPYRLEMIEAWARENEDVDLAVYYTDADDQGRGWTTRPAQGARETRLPVLANLGKYGKLNWGILRLVLRSDVVMIGGVEQATYLVAAFVARLAGRRPILLFDGFSPRRFGTERVLILAVKKLTARLCKAFFVNGVVGRRYVTEQLGVPASRPIFNQFLSHADEFHLQLLRETQGSTRASRRAEAGLPADQRIVMCCGYLIRRKRVDLVIDAIARLEASARPMLLVVGGGPLMEELKAQASSSGVSARFTGHLNGHDLAAQYYLADVLVLASDDDPWGLVVNEAMRAGLAVVVSDACGAALDLAVEGRNGSVFESGSSEALRAALAKVLAGDVEQMGRESQAMIAGWDAQASGRSLRQCLRSVGAVSVQ